MKKKLNSFMLLLVIVAVAMTSAVRTTPVYADDGGMEPVTEEGAAIPCFHFNKKMRDGCFIRPSNFGFFSAVSPPIGSPTHRNRVG